MWTTRYTSHKTAREICLLRAAARGQRLGRVSDTHARTHTGAYVYTHSVPRASPKSLPTMARRRRPSSSDNEQCWQRRRCQPTPESTHREAASLTSASPRFSSFCPSLRRSSPQSLPPAVRPRKRRGPRADCTTVRRQLANPLTPTGWTLDSLVKISHVTRPRVSDQRGLKKKRCPAGRYRRTTRR